MNAPSSQSVFDSEFFGYFMMLESVFGSLSVPASLYLTLNRKIHSLVFACVFMSTCNMTASIRRSATHGTDSALNDDNSHGDKALFLANPTDEYKTFLQQTIDKQKNIAKIKVIKTCLDLIEYMQTNQTNSFKALSKIVGTSMKIKSKTHLSMQEIGQPDDSNGNNIAMSALDFSVLKENGVEQAELIEEFEIRFNATQVRKEKLQTFIKYASPESIKEYKRSAIDKMMSGLTRLVKKDRPRNFLTSSNSDVQGDQSPLRLKTDQSPSPKERRAWMDEESMKPNPESDRMNLVDRTPKFSHVVYNEPEEDIPPDDYTSIPKPATDANRPTSRDDYLGKFRKP